MASEVKPSGAMQMRLLYVVRNDEVEYCVLFTWKRLLKPQIDTDGHKRKQRGRDVTFQIHSNAAFVENRRGSQRGYSDDSASSRY